MQVEGREHEDLFVHVLDRCIEQTSSGCLSSVAAQKKMMGVESSCCISKEPIFYNIKRYVNIGCRY